MSNPIVRMFIQGADPIIIELYPEKAPKTVAHFLELVREGYYDGLIFHRVIKGFMIQGGAHDTEFDERVHEGFVVGEFADNGWDKNDIPHIRGTISMARPLSAPDKANTQFFIMHGDCLELDGKYAAFGRVIEGIESVDTIANQPTSRFGMDHDVPLTLCVIDYVDIENEGEFEIE